MKGLNLSKFKKVKSDNDYTELQDNNGHIIRINNKHIGTGLRESLNALPSVGEPQKFFAGGPVKKPDEIMADSVLSQYSMQPDTYAQQFGAPSVAAALQHNPKANLNSETNTPVEAPTAPKLPTPIIDEASSTNQSNTDILPSQESIGVDQMMLGESEQIAGLKNEANAISAAAREQSKAAEAQQAQQLEFKAQIENNATQYAKDIDQVTADYNNAKIEPNRIFNNMDSMGRAKTVFALMLGGLGAGLAGGENMAMKALDDLIKRDVDAQKADMTKKENLVSMLNKKYGNVQDAVRLAHAYQADIYANELEKIAAKSKDPQAQARAQQQIGEMKAKYGAGLLQTAAEQAKAASASQKPPSVELGKIKFHTLNGMDAYKRLSSAFYTGTPTVSMVGDNKFTAALRDWAEAYGRVASGGAIGEKEQKEFFAMAPTVYDSREVQEQKLNMMRKKFKNAVVSFGLDSAEFNMDEINTTPRR